MSTSLMKEQKTSHISQAENKLTTMAGHKHKSEKNQNLGNLEWFSSYYC